MTRTLFAMLLIATPLAASAALVAAMIAAPALADITVAIPFAAEIGGKPFACGASYAGLGHTKATVQAVDFRLFVSEAALVRADGSLQPIALEQDGILPFDF